MAYILVNPKDYWGLNPVESHEHLQTFFKESFISFVSLSSEDSDKMEQVVKIDLLKYDQEDLDRFINRCKHTVRFVNNQGALITWQK